MGGVLSNKKEEGLKGVALKYFVPIKKIGLDMILHFPHSVVVRQTLFCEGAAPVNNNDRFFLEKYFTFAPYYNNTFLGIVVSDSIYFLVFLKKCYIIQSIIMILLILTLDKNSITD
jgi:hypothetical protein